jgi:hypothetical protein
MNGIIQILMEYSDNFESLYIERIVGEWSVNVIIMVLNSQPNTGLIDIIGAMKQLQWNLIGCSADCDETEYNY